jgi:hypothetical protein
MARLIYLSAYLVEQFYDPATCSYGIPIDGAVANEVREAYGWGEEMRRLRSKCSELRQERDRLRDENDGLRLLAIEANAVVVNHSYGVTDDECVARFRRHMRELGLE